MQVSPGRGVSGAQVSPGRGVSGAQVSVRRRCLRGAGVGGAQVLACGVPAPWARPQFPTPGPISIAGK